MGTLIPVKNMRLDIKSHTLNGKITNHLVPRASLHRVTPIMSKYGDESVYFDLGDMENTVGSWEMYGEDGKERYPALQEELFIRAGQALKRRATMLAFCTMSGAIAVLAWGAKGSRDVK